MIFGITGTDGAGKGTVVEYLSNQHGFAHYSSREFLLEEIKAAGLEPSRNELRLMGNTMRKKYGNEFIAKRAFDLILRDGISDAVIESIRAIAEAEYIKNNGGIMLAVDADVKTRYARVQSRRSESDKVNFETFVSHEELEKDDPDPNGMQKAKVIATADYVIKNNGSVEELYEQVEKLLQSIKNKTA